MYLLYSALLALSLLLLTPYFVVKGLRHKKYLHNLGQRLGRLPATVCQTQPGAIWLHAVSVGEVLAVVPLARCLKQCFASRPLLLSTVTLAGQQIIVQRPGLCDASFYFPFDFVFAVQPVLTQIKPALIVIAESEIWPNFLHQAQRAGVPVVFVNGRLSARSFHRHQMIPLWRRFLRGVLRQPAFFLMQTEQDAERLRALGAPPERMAVAGNLKFDVVVPVRPPFLSQLERITNNAPVIVAGSTMEGEETMLVDCLRGLQRQFSAALLVLAPRHPERFEEVARLLERRCVSFVRRSECTEANELSASSQERPDVFLLDTLGELAGTYATATVAFVGGTLVPAGGHNPVEPAVWGKPIVFGPFMENFSDMASAFLAAGAALQVYGADELGACLATLLGDARQRAAMGNAARALVEANRGATERVLEKVAELLGES